MKRSLKRIALALLAVVTPCLAWAETYEWNAEKGFVDSEGNPVVISNDFTITAKFTMPDETGAITSDILVFNATKVSDSSDDVGKIGFGNWTGDGNHTVTYVVGEATKVSGGHYSNARMYNGGTGENTLTITATGFNTGTIASSKFRVDFANGGTNTTGDETGPADGFGTDLFCFSSVTCYEGAVLTSATLEMDPCTTATINSDMDAEDIQWNLGAPTADINAKLIADAATIITMDAGITVAELALIGEDIKFVNPTEGTAGSLNATKTIVNANTDVSGITADLGDVTIAEGVRLTTGTNTTMTSIAGNGTLYLNGVELKISSDVSAPVNIGPDGGTITNTTTTDLVLSSVITGSGKLTLNGCNSTAAHVMTKDNAPTDTGSLAITGNSPDFTGTIEVASGVVYIGARGSSSGGADALLGNADSVITVKNGATFLTHLGGSNKTFANPIIAEDGAVIGNKDGHVTYTGNLTLSGNVAYLFGWKKNNIISGIVSGSGTLTIKGGVLEGPASTLTLSNADNAYTGTYKLESTSNAVKLIVAEGAAKTANISVNAANDIVQFNAFEDTIAGLSGTAGTVTSTSVTTLDITGETATNNLSLVNIVFPENLIKSTLSEGEVAWESLTWKCGETPLTSLETDAKVTIELVGNTKLMLASAVTLGSITVTGNGTLTIEGALLTTSTFVINKGANVITSVASIATNKVVMDDTATLALNHETTTSEETADCIMEITGGKVIKTGAGTLKFGQPSGGSENPIFNETIVQIDEGKVKPVLVNGNGDPWIKDTTFNFANETSLEQYGWIHGSGTITLNADEGIEVVAFNSNLSENTCTLKKTGAGKVTINVSNCPCAIEVDAGTLVATGANLKGKITTAEEGTIELTGGFTVPAIFGMGTFVKSGEGTAILSQNTTYPNRWRIAGGILQFADQAYSANYTIDVLKNATLELPHAYNKITSEDMVITLYSGATLIARNGNADGAIVKAQIKIDATEVDNPAIIKAGLYGNSTNFQNSIKGRGVVKFMTSDGNAYIIGGVISDESTEEPLRVVIATTNTVTLSNANTYTGGTEIATGATLALGENGSLGTGDLTVNGTLTGSATIATGKTVAGAGTISGALTLNDGAYLDPSQGSLFVGSVTFPENGTVTVVNADEAMAASSCILSVTAEGATISMTPSQVYVEDDYIAYVSDNTKLMLTPAVTEGIEGSGINEDGLAIIIEAAKAAGTPVSTITVAGGNTSDADGNSALELFSDIVDVDKDGEATIDWDFGISGIEVLRNTDNTVFGINVTATVQGTSNETSFVNGVKVKLYANGNLIATTTATNTATVTFKDVAIGDVTGELSVKATNDPQTDNQ